jgi:phosphatidylglycerol lysyltransferase
MFWARDQGYARFNLGAAPLSGIRASAVTPLWNQIALAARDVGERYYNFRGVRNFKDWFYPEWEAIYLVSPGGTRRPIILANIAALISGSARGVFRK